MPNFPPDLQPADVLAALLAGNPGAFGDVTLLTGQQPEIMYWSPELNLTATSSGNVIVPARAGYIFMPNRGVALVTDKNGALTGAATITVPTYLVSNAVLFNGTQFAFAIPSQSSFAVSASAILAAPISVSVDVASTGTGSFRFKGRVGLRGSWRAYP